jgi:hypothetical protein
MDSSSNSSSTEVTNDYDNIPLASPQPPASSNLISSSKITRGRSRKSTQPDPDPVDALQIENLLLSPLS